MIYMESIRQKKIALQRAIDRERSVKWILCLWSRFIKARDLGRCVCCLSTQGIQAHHIIRKSLYPWSAFDTGNGITLCSECHQRVHADFNGRPDLAGPLNAEGGDDQDEWAFLFGLLRDDATSRSLNEDDFYFLNDHILEFSVKIQGYKKLHSIVTQGEISRLRFAHEIWRNMPEIWQTGLVSNLIKLNMG